MGKYLEYAKACRTFAKQLQITIIYMNAQKKQRTTPLTEVQWLRLKLAQMEAQHQKLALQLKELLCEKNEKR